MFGGRSCCVHVEGQELLRLCWCQGGHRWTLHAALYGTGVCQDRSTVRLTPHSAAPSSNDDQTSALAAP